MTHRQGKFGLLDNKCPHQGGPLGEATIETHSTSSGTGLGLAICRDIFEGHGGSIEARNNQNGGATFTLVIPRLRLAH